ncbi:hypothetical protein LNTAR_11141 [Lentisphaera araneosa HTCC2155]|uniref:Uncharacterized protein n=1 Tax=Lentisphaera araneosa HTCC2155 TaxID=313628 RepID=A6DJ31_9BACT|nr:hypothetical protein LNTAR_11141 [Lentisphaera araneosa HTCC2155]
MDDFNSRIKKQRDIKEKPYVP